MQEQRELIAALMDEAAAISEALRGLEHQRYSRAMIRMVFSVFDSLLATLENYLLCIVASSDIPYERALSEIDGACLTLGAFKSNEKWERRNPSLDDKIKGLRKLSKFLDSEGLLKGKKLADTLSKKPKYFNILKRTRDEITHPKTLRSLQVSIETLEGLQEFTPWMVSIIKEVISTTYQEEFKLSFSPLRLLMFIDIGWLDDPVTRPEPKRAPIRLPDWVPPKP